MVDADAAATIRGFGRSGRSWASPSFRDGVREGPHLRQYNAGRHRMKSDLQQAFNTRDEQAQLRRLRQVAQTHQFDKEFSNDLKSASAKAAELSRRAVPGGAAAVSELGAQALHGIESVPPPVDPRPKVVKRSSQGNLAPLTRGFSLQSEEAMQRLSKLDESFVKIEQRVAEIEHLAKAGGQGVEKMRTELALLEAEANKLESKGVDSVYTSELGTGQAAAKEAKKALLRRLEALFAQIEGIFRGPLATGTIFAA